MSDHKDISNPRQVKRAKKAEKEATQLQIDDVKFLLKTKPGRRFFWRYLGRCGVFKSSFTGNSHTFFNEGERNIGLMLFNDLLLADPDAFTLMRDEAMYDAEVKEEKEGEAITDSKKEEDDDEEE